MTAGSYGSMRATDADRDKMHALLQSAYADGRLTWDEFDSRSSAVLAARTYGQLDVVASDLAGPAAVGAVPYLSSAGARPRTNRAAIVSLAFGLGQVFLLSFWLIGSIIAIVAGHKARRQIRETGETGASMAGAGLALGYAGVVIPLLITVLIVLTASLA